MFAQGNNDRTFFIGMRCQSLLFFKLFYKPIYEWFYFGHHGSSSLLLGTLALLRL